MKRLSNDSLEIGKRLKTFRILKGLSIQEVATRIGVAASTYREWENGRAITGNPYAKISSALGVGVYQILGLEDTSKDTLFSCLNELERCVQNLKRHL